MKVSNIEKVKQITQTYLFVFIQLLTRSRNSHNENKLYQKFRMIVEFVISLVEFLSTQFLAIFLNIVSIIIERRFRSLHFVMKISIDSNISIRILHLLFDEFLLSDQFQLKQFKINEQATHDMLFSKYLQLLFEFENLQKNLCKLEYFDKLRREIDQITINERLFLHFNIHVDIEFDI